MVLTWLTRVIGFFLTLSCRDRSFKTKARINTSLVVWSSPIFRPFCICNSWMGAAGLSDKPSVIYWWGNEWVFNEGAFNEEHKQCVFYTWTWDTFVSLPNLIRKSCKICPSVTLRAWSIIVLHLPLFIQSTMQRPPEGRRELRVGCDDKPGSVATSAGEFESSVWQQATFHWYQSLTR